MTRNVPSRADAGTGRKRGGKTIHFAADTLYTIGEIAEEADIPEETVTEWAHMGRGFLGEPVDDRYTGDRVRALLLRTGRIDEKGNLRKPPAVITVGDEDAEPIDLDDSGAYSLSDVECEARVPGITLRGWAAAGFFGEPVERRGRAQGGDRYDGARVLAELRRRYRIDSKNRPLTRASGVAGRGRWRFPPGLHYTSDGVLLVGTHQLAQRFGPGITDRQAKQWAWSNNSPWPTRPPFPDPYTYLDDIYPVWRTDRLDEWWTACDGTPRTHEVHDKGARTA